MQKSLEVKGHKHKGHEEQMNTSRKEFEDKKKKHLNMIEGYKYAINKALNTLGTVNIDSLRFSELNSLQLGQKINELGV